MSSIADETSVVRTATDRQTFGETNTTMETKIRLQESLTSKGNAATAEKEVTRLLVVGQKKENINMITSTTSLWDPHYVDNYKKITMKKILKNG